MKATVAIPLVILLGWGLLAPVGGYSQDTADSSAVGGADTVGVEAVEERRPILLVPGWMGRAIDLMALKERFHRDGWPQSQVLALEFADPVGSSLIHARELDDALHAFLEETGAEEVDVIAHSMGGLALWTLLQEKGGSLPLRRVVFLATPFQGTVTAHLAWGEGGPEMKPGSEFLVRLQGGHWPQYWVEALTVRTPLDVTVMPGERATLIGIADRVVCCPTHQGLLDHEETYLVTREFLVHGRSRERERFRLSPIWREWVRGVGGAGGPEKR